MLHSGEVNYSKICRTCLSNSEYLKSLYDEFSTDLCIAEVLMCFTSLEYYNDDDGMPTKICHDCFYKLNSMFKFIFKCKESDKRIRKRLEQSKNMVRNIYACKILRRKPNTAKTNSTHHDNPAFNFVSDLIQSGQNINYNIDLQLLGNNELEVANDLLVVEYEVPIPLENGVKSEKNDDKPIKSLTDPLTDSEVQHELNQELVLIKNEIYSDDSMEDNENHLKSTKWNLIESVDCAKADSALKSIQQPNKQMMNPTVVLEKINASNKVGKDKHRRSSRIRVKPYSCTVCHNSFSVHEDLVRHMRMHTGKKTYACTVCNKSYFIKECLQRHMGLFHSGLKAYSCAVSAKPLIEKHTDIMRRRHNGIHKDKPYSCTVCNSPYKYKKCLQRHEREHFTDKPVNKCTYCSKSFSFIANLRKHMLTHKCAVCPKSFAKNTQLRRHMLVHATKCKLCSKLYYTKNTFNQHMRTHSTKKQYTCTLCPVSFYYKAILDKHILKHTLKP